MLKMPKHSGTNYKAIKGFLDVVDANDGYSKFTSGGFEDLVIENVWIKDYAGRPVYSIAHYYIQNGDMMRDPEMTVAIDKECGRVIPVSYRQDCFGTYQEVFKMSGGKTYYHERLLRELDDFLWMWLKNVSDQGFSPDVFVK